MLEEIKITTEKQRELIIRIPNDRIKPVLEMIQDIRAFSLEPGFVNKLKKHKEIITELYEAFDWNV